MRLSGNQEVVNIFFSHLIIYMSDSNLVSVLAYVQAFFLNSENVDKWCVFADHTVSDSTYKMELFHDTALLSLGKIISCDMMLLGKELLYMVCKEGVINSLLLWNLFFSIVFFFFKPKQYCIKMLKFVDLGGSILAFKHSEVNSVSFHALSAGELRTKLDFE